MAKKTLKYSGGGFGLDCLDVDGKILQPKCRYTLELPGKILVLLNITLQELESLCEPFLAGNEPVHEEKEGAAIELETKIEEEDDDDENKAERGPRGNPECEQEAKDFLPKVQDTFARTVMDLNEALKLLNTMEPIMKKKTNRKMNSQIDEFKGLVEHTIKNIEKMVDPFTKLASRLVNHPEDRENSAKYRIMSRLILTYQKLIIFQQNLIQNSAMEAEREVMETILVQLNNNLKKSQLRAGTTPWEGLDYEGELKNIQKIAETCDNMENDNTSIFVWALVMGSNKFPTRTKADKCNTFKVALRYIYLVISGTEGIIDQNAECEKKNKSKAPWYKKPKFLSLLAPGRDQLPAIYRMCLTTAIGILWKLEGKCRLLVYMFFPDFITSIIAKSWKTNKNELAKKIKEDWNSVQNYYKHVIDLAADQGLDRSVGLTSLKTAYENIRTDAHMPQRIKEKEEWLQTEMDRQVELLRALETPQFQAHVSKSVAASMEEQIPGHGIRKTGRGAQVVPVDSRSKEGGFRAKLGGGQFTDEILSVSLRKGIKGVIRRLTRFFILMLSIPDLVDNCPNKRQSGDQMTRVLAQFGKEKLVYMVDFKKEWKTDADTITEKNVSGIQTIVRQFHEELERNKKIPGAALENYKDFLDNIQGLSQNEQLLKVGKIKEAREKYGKAEIAAATLKGDDISPILQESVQRDLTSKLQAIVRCTMLYSYDDAICKKAIKDFEERLQDIKWYSKERMRKASLPSSEHEEKEQPSTDDDDDSELDEYTADVAARGGARMKAGEESSWERLIAEQNRQLEDYREKAAKVEEKLKSYKRTIAHEERQITSNSGNPAAAAAAKRRKKAAEAKAIPVMKRWKTFNRNIEKIQERRRGIYAKIEEQRKAKRVARDAQRASASQRYASQTMEDAGDAE